MAGKEQLAASAKPEKVALWVKDAMDRLDAAAAPEMRNQIMTACGHNCLAHNPRPLTAAAARRRKYPSEDAFLTAEIQKPPAGMRFEREGKRLIHYYTPHAFGKGMRCFCSLMRGLPEDMTASATYCQCSRGFVEKYWESILGRPVRVDLGETAISGADECKFIIHL
jgi:hypothetical protein